MEMQPISRAEPHNYRISYKKHRQRLSEMKTSLNFHPSIPRPYDRKRQLNQKIKLNNIELQNHLLQEKIAKIQSRRDQLQMHSTQRMKSNVTAKQNSFHRYDNDEDKIEVKSDYQDNQVKFIVPMHKSKAVKIFRGRSLKNANESQRQIYSLKNTQQLLKSSLHHKPKLEKHQQDKIYFDPQFNQKRQILYKKTSLLSPLISCLLEVSLLGRRLLVTAHIMGLQSEMLTLIVEEGRASEVLKQINGNYEEFKDRIIIVKQNQKNILKLKSKKIPKPDVENHSEEKSKEKHKIQQQFIKRNYYTLIKKDEKEQHQSQPRKINNKLPQSKINALIQRLSGPKIYQQLAKVDPNQNQIIKEVKHLPPKNPIPIKHKNQNQLQKNAMVLKPAHKIKSQQKVIQQKYIQNKSSEQKIVNKSKQEEKQQDYDDEQYEDQFSAANESKLIKSKQIQHKQIKIIESKAKQIKNSSQTNIKNNSSSQIKNSISLGNKNIQAKVNEHVQTIKNDSIAKSNAYDEEFEEENAQNYQQQAQNYQQQFQDEASKSKSQLHNRSAVSRSGMRNQSKLSASKQIVDEIYEEQFQS